MSDTLSYEVLTKTVRGAAAAFRSITELQPVEGAGGKIFPATYSKGVYATERRRLRDGHGGPEREVDCVLLNSVQSEANHAEEALQRAIELQQISLPLIEVDFKAANEKLKQPLPNLTSLTVPHRLADAILRDSQLADGTRFSKSECAKKWARANLWNATPIFEICPTALVFGMWGSPEKPGGLGAKFERAFVSETVAVDIVPESQDPAQRKSSGRMGFRIDPLSVKSAVLIKQRESGTFSVIGDSKEKNALKPSEINHGNILFEAERNGVRCRFAEQTTVISLGALRKLRFPIEGKFDLAVDGAARTVLASIALCAAVLASEQGTSLRSRCHLFPTKPPVWQLLEKPGQTPGEFTIDGEASIGLLKKAIAAAQHVKLPWMKDKLTLTPTDELVELVRQSQELAAKEKGDGETQ